MQIPRSIVIVVLPVTVGIFYLTASGHFGYTPDDTFIYLQYAKHVVGGEGLSFNAGQPTYGFTSPLWLILISFGGFLGLDLYVVAKTVDIVLASASLFVFYFVAFEVIRDMIPSLLATLAFAFNVWLVRWAGTGMETSLSVCLVLLTALYTLRNEYMLAVIAGALVSLTRPEGIAFVGFVFADLFLNSRDRRVALRKAGLLALLFVALMLPWYAYAQWTFGSVVSNTELAKSNWSFDAGEIFTGALDMVETVTFSDGVALLVMLASIIWLLVQRRVRRREEEDTSDFFLARQHFIGVGWLLLLPLCYSLLRVNVVSRYLLLVTPFIGIGAFGLLNVALGRSAYRRFSHLALVMLTALILLQNQFTYWTIVKPGVSAFEAGLESTLVDFGKWLKSYSNPSDVVFAWDIGALGYFSDRTIVDGSGLATPEMIPWMRSGFGVERMMKEKFYRKFGSASFVVCRSEAPEAWASPGELKPIRTVPFARMGLAKKEVVFFTLYQVQTPSHSISHE